MAILAAPILLADLPGEVFAKAMTSASKLSSGNARGPADHQRPPGIDRLVGMIM